MQLSLPWEGGASIPQRSQVMVTSTRRAMGERVGYGGDTSSWILV